MKNPANGIDVLLIEDHPGDARLTQEALRGRARPIHLHHAWDGVEAMAFLRHEGIHVDAPRPSVILLDLNMPRMCGRETLGLIKGDAILKSINPGDRADHLRCEADVSACYRLGANCYFRKPPQWDAFDNLLRAIDDFWFSTVELPSIEAGSTIQLGIPESV